MFTHHGSRINQRRKLPLEAHAQHRAADAEELFLNGEVAESRLKDCRYAVWVVLSGADAGEPLFRHMELMIADHSTVVAEFKAMRALAEQKKQERYEQQKKAALPSL